MSSLPTAWWRSAPARCSAPGRGCSPVGAAPPTTSYWTCSGRPRGITAGIDLALHLIAEECGEALAATVAEDMVVYFRRTPSDPELSPFLVHRRHFHPAVHRVQDAILGRPAYDWNMASLASVGHTTERHLLRLFREHVGIPPLEYLRSIRLERARQALECGASVTRAAESAGFSSDQQLRRAWSRQWGGSPRDVARREQWECPAPADAESREERPRIHAAIAPSA